MLCRRLVSALVRTALRDLRARGITYLDDVLVSAVGRNRVRVAARRVGRVLGKAGLAACFACGKLALSSACLCFFCIMPALWPTAGLNFLMQKRLRSSNIVSAGLSCATAQGRTASLPDIRIENVHMQRHVSGSGGTCGVSTFKLVDMRCIRTTRTYACE